MNQSLNTMGDGSVGDPPFALLVTINIALLLTSGVLVSAWLLYYTDWFPIVGGLLGLAGLFAWVGVLMGLVSDARKKQLRSDSRGVLQDA